MGEKVQDIFSKITTVKIYGKYDYETEGFASLISLTYNAYKRKIFYSSILLVHTTSRNSY